MKFRNLYILTLAIFCGCGNKNVLLIDQAPMTPAVNPATKAIIKNSRLVYARLDGGDTIHGITTGNAFRTTNDFADFVLNPVSLNTANTPYSFNGNRGIYGSVQAMSSVINYSTDYGNSWTSFSPVFSPALISSGFYSSGFLGFSLVGDQGILALYVQQSTYNGNSRQLYKVNVTTKTASLVWAIQDAYLPLAMQFANAKTGWMLLSSGGTWLSGTTDSGATWTSPVRISYRSLPNLRVSEGGQLAAYSTSGYAYFSGDNGATWKEAPDTLQFSDISIAQPSLLYGLTGTGLKKSTDGGVTWNMVFSYSAELNSVGKLFFKDGQNGLAYGNEQLFLTGDGGQSWKVLLYPYSYITQ
jgi:hypothetical protein